MQHELFFAIPLRKHDHLKTLPRDELHLFIRAMCCVSKTFPFSTKSSGFYDLPSSSQTRMVIWCSYPTCKLSTLVVIFAQQRCVFDCCWIDGFETFVAKSFSFWMDFWAKTTSLNVGLYFNKTFIWLRIQWKEMMSNQSQWESCQKTIAFYLQKQKGCRYRFRSIQIHECNTMVLTPVAPCSFYLFTDL